MQTYINMEMQKADLRIELFQEVWEAENALKNAPWLLLSVVFHFLLGGALWLSVLEEDRLFSDEVVDLTLSSPATHLGSGTKKTALPLKVKSTVRTDTQATGTAESPAAAAAADAGSSPVGWGEVTRFPKVLSEIKAIYPPEAKKAGIDGPVVMEILIDHTGKVREVKVISGPEYGLKESAIAAIKKFEFQPALRDSEPVAVKIRYTYRFKLGVN